MSRPEALSDFSFFLNLAGHDPSSNPLANKTNITYTDDRIQRSNGVAALMGEIMPPSTFLLK